MPNTIADMTPDAIRAAVADQYGRVTRWPDGQFPFPVGRDFAESLGYPSPVLDSLPRLAVEAFAGISCPLAFADLQPGEAVLDLGCGAGMDTILIGRQVGPRGHVHALDLSVEMLEAARTNAARAGLENVTFHLAPAESMPLPEEAVDAVVVNGIFNLCPAKEPAMREAHRVLRPGGRLLTSEIVLSDSDDGDWIGIACGLTLDDWFR